MRSDTEPSSDRDHDLPAFLALCDPWSWISEESRQWRSEGLERVLSVKDESLVDFGSNDYLNLAGDARVKQAATDVLERHGFGSRASALITGWQEPHQALSEALADFEGVEAVLLFPTGYAANVGCVTALVGTRDVVYVDRLNHASLIDGAKLSGAKLRVFSHNDPQRLEDLLKRDRGRFARSLITVDGVFSMDGDLAPLPSLVDLAERYGAMLFVDEAHGTGVFGPHGKGASAALGVADRVGLKVGTLSKALGSLGGFAAGSRELINWLINRARTQMFSTALPPSAAAAARKALEISQAEPWRRERLFELGQLLRRKLKAANFEVMPSEGPISPVLAGSPQRAIALSRGLRERGWMVPAIRPPTVPKQSSRLRICLNASHDEVLVSKLVKDLSDLADLANLPDLQD